MEPYLPRGMADGVCPVPGRNRFTYFTYIYEYTYYINCCCVQDFPSTVHIINSKTYDNVVNIK